MYVWVEKKIRKNYVVQQKTENRLIIFALSILLCE